VTHVITTFPNEQVSKRVEHSNYDSAVERLWLWPVGEEKPGRGKKRKENQNHQRASEETSAAHHPPGRLPNAASPAASRKKLCRAETIKNSPACDEASRRPALAEATRQGRRETGRERERVCPSVCGAKQTRSESRDPQSGGTGN
jgi:hypothetical protein